MAKATIFTKIRGIARLGVYFVVNVYFRLLLFTPYQHIQKHVMASEGPPAPKATARWIGTHVFLTSLYVPGATCLSRAFCAQFFLKRKGYASLMAIGVADGIKGMTAHAWVMSGTEVVVGNEEGQIESFTLLTELGPPKI